MTEASRAALLMTLCMAAYSSSDTVMKLLGEQMPLGQALFLRGIGTTLFMALWAAQRGDLVRHLDRKDRRLVAARALSEVAAGFFFVSALFNLPLANATAILQALPLTVTLAAAWFFGERLGARSLIAIAVGFFGVLLILRPGPEGFDFHSLYALAAVLSVTARDLLTRAFPAHVPSLTAAVWSSLAVTLFGAGLGVGEDWVHVNTIDWLMVALASLAITAASLLAVLSMRVGEAGGSAPFRYTALVWALLLGLIVFGEWPDPITLGGAGLVVISGLYALGGGRAQRRMRAGN